MTVGKRPRFLTCYMRLSSSVYGSLHGLRECLQGMKDRHPHPPNQAKKDNHTDKQKSCSTFYALICETVREGNRNPLQYSCLENPVDRGAWWAAIYGVTQSQT